VPLFRIQEEPDSNLCCLFYDISRPINTHFLVIAYRSPGWHVPYTFFHHLMLRNLDIWHTIVEKRMAQEDVLVHMNTFNAASIGCPWSCYTHPRWRCGTVQSSRCAVGLQIANAVHSTASSTLLSDRSQFLQRNVNNL
jgi:hypothetical protein